MRNLRSENLSIGLFRLPLPLSLNVIWTLTVRSLPVLFEEMRVALLILSD
jgi:hypothetical protein